MDENPRYEEIMEKLYDLQAEVYELDPCPYLQQAFQRAIEIMEKHSNEEDD